MDTNLYTFKKNAWHVLFFTWLWGVNPVNRYKTMCPYFWQFVGSLFILPLIITGKYFIKFLQYCDKKLSEKNKLKTQEYIAQLKLIVQQEKLSDKEYYNLYKSKYYRKTILDHYHPNIEYIENKIYDKYTTYKKYLNNKSQKQQQIIDNLTYGWIGKLFLYLITGLTITIVSYFIYIILHLFTFAQFLNALGIILTTIIFIFLMVLLVFLIITIHKIVNKYTFIKIPPIDYWKYPRKMWNIIKLIIITVFKGFKVIIDMIKNLYNKSCPIITWKD